MKKILFLLLYCICFSCNDDKESSISRYNIPYSLQPDIEKDAIVIIDSEAAFREAFVNTESSLPAINFKDSNLLLVSGVSSSGISELDTDFIKDGSKYRLNIEVEQNYATVVQPWCIGYRIPKDLKRGDVVLNIKYSLD